MADLISGIRAWGIGFQYTLDKKDEDEVRQGKNHILASLSQMYQFAIFDNVLQQIHKLTPDSALSKNATKVSGLSFWLTVPFLFICAGVKEGRYKDYAPQLNNYMSRMSGDALAILPEKLGARTIKLCSFTAEHSGDVLHVAMIASSLAVIVLGNPIYGAGALTALTYGAIDRMSLVPRKISLFMERYMPIVSAVVIIAAPEMWFVSRIHSLISLSSFTFSLSRKMLYAVDSLFRKLYGVDNLPVHIPSLREYDAPLLERKYMTRDEIVRVLDDDPQSSELNPAALGKWACDLNVLPTNDKFSEFESLFSSVDWSSKTSLIRGKCKDDERFIDMLKGELTDDNPDVAQMKKEDIQAGFDKYVEMAALQKRKTVDAYLLDHINSEFALLIKVLSGEVRCKGKQAELDDGITNAKKILPYLQKLQSEGGGVELEDLLLKLAVECGGYCSLGIKRATNEMMSNVLRNSSVVGDDPLEASEIRIRRSLEEKRFELIQSSYGEMLKEIGVANSDGKGILEDQKQDVHFYDTYRMYLSLAFTPLTEHEKRDLDESHIAASNTCNGTRVKMFTDYQKSLSSTLHEQIGEIHIMAHIQGLLNANTNLNEADRKYIMEIYAGSHLSFGDSLNPRFHNLLLVMMGVRISLV
jgi:hypothetical protein